MPDASAKPLSQHPDLPRQLRAILERTWGFSDLRPLQLDAVSTTLDQLDSLTVLPTGGGKSLCYQLPPLLLRELAPGRPSLGLVISPLIALMKDQVDGLRLAGYPAAALHSGIPAADAAEIRERVEAGEIALLLVSPERLLTEGFLAWIVRLAQRNPSRGVAYIAIDEAHCISQWGHDFRPEYRRIAEFHQVLPGIPLHAYTATATPRVRTDICNQLQMRDPRIHVGIFDRPNLSYRILPRIGKGEDQIEQALRRHDDQAAIVYCITRDQTERLADAMRTRGLDARAYHAGLNPKSRLKVQDDFASERLNIVVATVAFGMGIDRSDVRCVVHASMPKSVEAYQQETGRAGRDGLPAECVLLYASADAAKWLQLIDRSAAESDIDVPQEVIEAQQKLVSQMQGVATAARCRHRALSEYFGQQYTPADPSTGCAACDVCLNELDEVPDAQIVAQKILSCVARLRGPMNDQAFGAPYVAEVLRGVGSAKVLQRAHHALSTFGILRTIDKDLLINCIHQLVDDGSLIRDPGQYPVIRLGPNAVATLRAQRQVRLLAPKSAEAVTQIERSRTRRRGDNQVERALSAPEQALFDALRALRRSIAQDMGVPPFVVFSDAPLLEMAKRRPDTVEAFATIRGVGRAKLTQFGQRFIDALLAHCRENGLPVNVQPSTGAEELQVAVPRRRSRTPL